MRTPYAVALVGFAALVVACSRPPSAAPAPAASGDGAVERDRAIEWVAVAASRRRAGDLAGAMTALDAAVAANPELELAWGARGEANLALGRLDQAIDDLSTAIRLAPRDGRAYRLRAIAHRRRGEAILAAQDEQAARVMLDDRARLTPRNPAAARLDVRGRRLRLDTSRELSRDVSPP